MIKKSLFLVLISSLSACSTYYEAKNCDPERNYVISNPEEIENFKLKALNNKINGIYIKRTPAIDCTGNSCLYYETNKYNFVERYLNDKTRNGVYKIQISEKNNPSCVKSNIKSDKNCYIITKNFDNKIFSDYSLEILNDKKTEYRKVTNLLNNKILFSSAYQAYSIPSLSGEPTGGFCFIKDNNPKYKFNILSFP